ARATLHGTTTTGNVGFRCAKAPKRRLEYHYVYENEEVDPAAELVMEGADGTRQYPKKKMDKYDEMLYEDDEFDDEVVHDPTKPRPDERRKRKRVVKPRTLTSDEL
ncbi:hypothetical protein THAOC_00108, partial [Thalassiosira oceanica]